MNNLMILKAVSGELRGQEFTFATPVRCVLGRSRACGLRLPFDPTVSRQHCLLESDGNGIWAQDLCSLNGTFVNGSKIGTGLLNDGDGTVQECRRHRLRDGDELRVAGNVFQVVLSGALADSRQDCTMALCG